MFGLLSQNIEDIRRIFMSVPSVQEAIVYGSRARGDNRRYSDLDITLRGDDISDGDMTKIYFMIDDLLLPYTVDLSIYSHIRNEKLIANIINEGKLLYSKKSVS